MVSVFGSLPRVPPQNCHFEWPLAERRKTGTDALEPLDTFWCQRLCRLNDQAGFSPAATSRIHVTPNASVSMPKPGLHAAAARPSMIDAPAESSAQ